MTIRQILDRMESYHKPLDPERRTCDGIITGDVEKECTGVAVTCCSTAEAIRKAAELGCNLMITHEPTFFHGFDETEWLSDNSVYAEKKQLIEQTGMTIFRNHDRLHSDNPDGIFNGVVKMLGWEKYGSVDSFMPGACFELGKTTVGEIAKHMIDVLHIDGMRIIGDPDMEVSRAGFIFHFNGGPMDKELIEFIEKNDMQVIIPGEIVDWTIGEYVQDAVCLGKKRALLNVGHFNWEEPGMEYMAKWLPDVIGHEVPVHFIQSGNQYRWISK